VEVWMDKAMKVCATKKEKQSEERKKLGERSRL